jgi:organic radical activating enzyme
MKPGARSGGELLKARLTEVMESIQGEGLLAGCRQVFVRFSGCNLHCRYCDTPFSTRPAAYCHISPHPGRRKDVITVANPVSVAQLIEFIAPYSSRWVSLTGESRSYGQILLSSSVNN